MPSLSSPLPTTPLNTTLNRSQLEALRQREGEAGVSLYLNCLKVINLQVPEINHPLNPIPDDAASYTVSASPEEKKKNLLLNLPPSLVGYLAIPAAYGVVHLPHVLNRLMVGPLNAQDKAYIERMKIVDLQKSRYTPEQYAAKVKQADAILKRFKTEGDAWFANSPAVKYFLSKHTNPETNRLVAVARLKQQVMMEAMFLKYGREIHRLQDMDGTQVFKNFATATNHVEPNISAKSRLAHYLTIAYNVKSREALNYSNQHQHDPHFSTQSIVKELTDLGFFNAKHLEPEQLNQFLKIWGQNTDAAFPHMSQSVLKYYLQAAIESANTARAGWKINSNNEAIPPNDVWGLGVLQHLYDLKGQMGYFEMLGHDRRPDLATQYILANINGYQGKTVADGQVYHPQEMIQTGYSGLHELLHKTGLYEKIMSSKELPRVIEYKGNYAWHDKALVTDHLYWRSQQLSAKELEWIKKTTKITDKTWKNATPEERAKWVNLMDRQMPSQAGSAATGKPAMALPQVWLTEMDKLTADVLQMIEEIDQAPENKNKPKDFSPVLKLLNTRTRRLNAEDHAFLNSPHLEVVDGHLLPAQERLAKVKAYTQKSLNQSTHGVVPMGEAFLKRIEAMTKSGASKEELHAFLQDINTVDYGCLTVHSILANLKGVYETWQNKQSDFPADFAKAIHVGDPNAKGKDAVLESGKSKIINLIVNLCELPEVQALLEKEGMDMMRIKSSSHKLRYNLDSKKPSLFNLINNSGGDNTFEVFDKVTKIIANQYGFNYLVDPTASYFEGSFIEIDKGSVIAAIQHATRFMHMSGDSTGSDMSAIAYLSTLSPLNTSEVVRGMIDNNKLMNEMIDVMNYDKMCANQIKALTNEYRKNGLSEKDLEAAKKMADAQFLANPLRYQIMGRNAQGKLQPLSVLNAKFDPKTEQDKLFKAEGFQLIGKGHEAVLEMMGYEADKLLNPDEYRELFSKFFKDVMNPTVFHADDVEHKHLRDALAKGFVHGDEDQVLRFLKNTHLADGFLDHIPGFENRSSFSLGMPFHMGFTLKDWQVPLHKFMNSNVYSPVNRALLKMGPLAMKGAETGGILAVGGGLLGATATYLQLQEHAKYQQLHTWDRDNPDGTTPVDFVRNNIVPYVPGLSLYRQVKSNKLKATMAVGENPFARPESSLKKEDTHVSVV